MAISSKPIPGQHGRGFVLAATPLLHDYTSSPVFQLDPASSLAAM
jgi:hypothetical protein